MKKFTKIAAVLLALLLCGPLFGQYDDDEPAPGRRHRRGGIMNKTLSIGLIGSVHMKTDVLDDNDDVITSIEDASKKANIGLSFRWFPFMRGKLGVGIDMIMLQQTEYWSVYYGDWVTMTDFMVDFNILLRFRVGRSLTVNGGIGYSQYATTWEDSTYSDTEWGKLGFNVKLGAEYFVTRNISITGDLKYTFFTYDNYDPGISTDQITYRHYSVVLGVHYWL